MTKQPKSFEQILAEKRAAENARRREATLRSKLSDPQVALSDLERSYLRKGERLAFPDKLEPYQLQAVLMTIRNYRTGVPTLNASDVGLGKTRESASFITTVGFRRVLWFTKKGILLEQTVKELNSLDPDRLIAVPIHDQSELWVTQMFPMLHTPAPDNKFFNPPSEGPSPSPSPYSGKTVVFVTHYEVIHRDSYLFKPSPNHRLPAKPQENALISLTYDKTKPGTVLPSGSSLPNHLSSSDIERVTYPLGKNFPVAFAPSDGYAHPKGPEWDCIIVDEATKLRNGASYQPPQFYTKMKALLHLCHPETYKLFLTATPAENRPEELWAYFHLFKPERFNDLASFRRIFETRNDKGERVVDVERLLGMLGSMVIRHTVANLGLNMPTLSSDYWFKTKTHKLHIDPDSHVGQAYLSMQSAALAELDSYTVLNPKVLLEVMLRLRQLLSAGPVFTFSKTIKRLSPTPNADGSPKIIKDKQTFTVKMEPPYHKHDAVEQLIAELQAEGEQVIVMSCFNQPLYNLHNSLQRVGVYTSGVIAGETSEADRRRYVSEFQQGRLDVLLINKMAGAHGLNLQKCDNWPGGASHIIHMDRWWSPAVERQANGRIVRMNTKFPCTAHYFEVQNSMDTAMRDLVEAKADAVHMMDVELMKDTIRRSQLG